MIRYLLLNVPDIVLTIGVIGGSVLLMLLATRLIRKRFPEHIHNANNEVAGFIFAAVAVIYGVMLAFVVIVVWQTLEETHNIVANEANAVVDLYRFSWELPSPYDTTLRSAVENYTLATVNQEWDAMARGTSSPAVDVALEDIWGVYRELHRAKLASQLSDGSLYESIQNISNARNLRLNESRTEIPPLMWLLLWGGGILMLGFTLFFRSPNERAHLTMVAMLTAVVAVVLLLIMELDIPFAGSIHISSKPFEDALQTIQRLGGN
ncbi:MAG: DUF4239 domain-containing protein [Chloroflexi bacterium]|nr:DUF4239 domain-containing protein [Chloroflexota bacterium]